MSKNIFDEIDSDLIIEQFYRMAVADYNQGTSLSQLREILNGYESAEMFWECAGIKKAIDEIESIEQKIYNPFQKFTSKIRRDNEDSN